LADGERIRIDEYFENIKFAGTRVNTITIKPDEIVLSDVTVFHDGVRADADVLADVTVAMDNFLVTLPFDGVFYIQSFTDAIQTVNNVVDVYIVEINRDSFLNDENTPDRTLITRKTVLDAGYAKISGEVAVKIALDN